MTTFDYVAPRPARWPLRRLVGVAILGGLLAFAFLPLVIGGADPLKQTLRLTLQGPSIADWFGYDHLGRSMQARLAGALRLSLGLALLSVFRLRHFFHRTALMENCRVAL